ncbi:hypothetical protein [Alicyclobacillus macrosporangiidus]|uniref:Uncharacterized protein n=1 Tax=Alicyclobacillus macrosporangiidus TaxID=392015 RepID=A0A1I7GZ77_9BACL|nr:hypothetical protein [Alicyclobacillus macrosporangiidus]SFU53758.1 hypothetical protein SAMN05421543_103143 [Alicyclobacillus macrosporangiidus]
MPAGLAVLYLAVVAAAASGVFTPGAVAAAWLGILSVFPLGVLAAAWCGRGGDLEGGDNFERNAASRHPVEGEPPV